MKRVLWQSLFFGVATLCASDAVAGEKKQHTSKLQAVVNDAGQIVLIWNGKEKLAEARGKDGKFKQIHQSTSPYVVTAAEDQALVSAGSGLLLFRECSRVCKPPTAARLVADRKSALLHE